MEKADISQAPLISLAFQKSKDEVVTYTQRPTIRLDNKGVLQYKIPYTNHWDYYPIFMARYAIGYLELFEETQQTEHRDTFFHQVTWLQKNLVDKGTFAVWEHHYPLPYFEYHIPWVHGLAQGLGLVTLLKAYQLTNESHYKQSAEKVFRSFLISVDKGGIQSQDDHGNIWLEEYALTPAPHVLNGFITILFAIYEYHHLMNSKSANDLWNQGIQTLTTNLHQFDLGYWSMYDLLRKYPATTSYHNLHIRQMNILYQLTNDPLFQQMEKTWNAYRHHWINKQKAGIRRGIIHIQRYGIRKAISRYFQRKHWEQPTSEE